MNGSFFWSSIHNAYLVLKDGFQFQLGKGHTNLWFSSWLDDSAFCSKVPYIHISNSDL
uniref:Uncharacterized protein n=1 Tax=Cajanus cajan TaxID=3821 RepID=A0A151SQU3_CAJCA|nr:hypothetical protein KK1_003379 [Cajanus cajan]